MALTKLCANTLGDLSEGMARGVIDAALGKIYADLEDRGEDGNPRVLTIEVTFQKTKGLVVIDTQVAAKLPKYRTRATHGEPMQQRSRDGKTTYPVLAFQEHDAENPSQNTFSEMDKAEGEVDE